MLKVNDYVRRKGTKNPVGIVEVVFGPLLATIRWGVADGKVFREDINQDELEVVEYDILNKAVVEHPPLRHNVFRSEDGRFIRD